MRPRNRRLDAARLVGLLVALLAAGAVEAADKKKSRLAPQALVAGSVFQESGFTLKGARVVAFNADRPRERKETTTDLQGEFAMRFPAGKARYTLEASAPGFVAEKKTVDVEGDERIEVTFRLAPLGR